MAEETDTERVTAGDALAVIGKIEPGALKLVGDLMEYSARSTAWGFEMAYEGERHAHEETQAKLDAALRHIALMEHRIGWLLGHHDDPPFV